MLLDVSKGFLAPGTSVPFEAKVCLPPQDVTGEMVSFDDVELHGAYNLADDTIHLTGTLQTVAHGQCALCLSKVDWPLQVEFNEMFRKDADESVDEAFRYEGKAVPLTQLVLTLVMLNVPMRFLCGEGCKASGELQAWQNDISKSSCEDGAPTQRPFEALQRLLKKDEEV